MAGCSAQFTRSNVRLHFRRGTRRKVRGVVGSFFDLITQASGNSPGLTSFFFQISQVVSSCSTRPSERNRKICLAFQFVEGMRLSKDRAWPSQRILLILNFSPSERQNPETPNRPRIIFTMKAAFESSSSVIHVPTRGCILSNFMWFLYANKLFYGSVYLLYPWGRKVCAHEEVLFLMVTWSLKTPELH